jgi:hypothetical protein
MTRGTRKGLFQLPSIVLPAVAYMNTTTLHILCVVGFSHLDNMYQSVDSILPHFVFDCPRSSRSPQAFMYKSTQTLCRPTYRSPNAVRANINPKLILNATLSLMALRRSMLVKYR